MLRWSLPPSIAMCTTIGMPDASVSPSPVPHANGSPFLLIALKSMGVAAPRAAAPPAWSRKLRREVRKVIAVVLTDQELGAVENELHGGAGSVVVPCAARRVCVH